MPDSWKPELQLRQVEGELMQVAQLEVQAMQVWGAELTVPETEPEVSSLLWGVAACWLM